MFISLNWIRDFVALPADVDARALAEQFTVTTAEVEGVSHITCDAAGLIAAEVLSVQYVPDRRSMFLVQLDTGAGKLFSVTIATDLKVGDRVIYAPPGARLPKIGNIGSRKMPDPIAGLPDQISHGMIVPADSLGLETVGQRAIWLPPDTPTGAVIDLREFEDWIIEVDNKSITNRPDLWGHYGIAREVAAMCGLKLKSYEVTPLQELQEVKLPEVPIVIDDPRRCPRYSALRFTGVQPQPAPLWMQVRLAHVGMRPIDILVDLTNYIMAEIGQPMHAFDGSSIEGIEVALAKAGEVFRTLDGVDRTMPENALMIQANRKSVALAGIMGGAETEVTASTTSLLLESANFDPATIRRCATALGHRTEASARFEKSLDPLYTLLGIQRFVYLAKPQLPEMKLTSRLSDAFPHPPEPTIVSLSLDRVNQYIGRPIPRERVIAALRALEFGIQEQGDTLLVTVPSFRATKDVSIEADVIEEVARSIGYGSIEPVAPEVTVRYAEPDRISQLERKTLNVLCKGLSYAEVHRYVWFDNTWLKRLNFEPGDTIVLKNPAAAGMERLRTTLVPGLLAAVDLNRHGMDRFDLLEIGSVFRPVPGDATDAKAEHKSLGLAVVAPGRKAAQEDALFGRLKSDVETWAFQVFGESLRYVADPAVAPWENPAKTATIMLGEQAIGRITVVPAACKRAMDEHLAAWSIALAEIDLSAVMDHQVQLRKLAPVPVYPQIEVDFSVLADATRRYVEIEAALAKYDHALLRRLAFVDSYEGGSVPAGKRSFMFRATIGDASRTLVESDIQSFREDFIAYLNRHDLVLRA